MYAVEASDSSRTAHILAEANGFLDHIEIIHGKIEDIELPEKVDIIISEPIGFLLVSDSFSKGVLEKLSDFIL